MRRAMWRSATGRGGIDVVSFFSTFGAIDPAITDAKATGGERRVHQMVACPATTERLIKYAAAH